MPKKANPLAASPLLTGEQIERLRHDLDVIDSDVRWIRGGMVCTVATAQRRLDTLRANVEIARMSLDAYTDR